MFLSVHVKSDPIGKLFLIEKRITFLLIISLKSWPGEKSMYVILVDIN